jgi:threonine dehydrogenase-like Zn-dependent dehydrogenase
VRAMSVIPGHPESATVANLDEPSLDDGSVLVEAVLVGLCGTDAEIIAEGVGSPLAGQTALVIGHETVARVLRAPASSGFVVGDLVTGIVRLPDPVPCAACARGEWDFCRNGLYTEHGIRGSAGFGRERWRSEPAYLVRVPDGLGELGVFIEPMSVICKALEAASHIASRAYSAPKRMLVTGAGPIGLLAAAAGRVAGFDVTVLDRMAQGSKPDLARAVGATYTNDLDTLGGMTTSDIFVASESGIEPFDVILECSGAAAVFSRAATMLSQAGVLVLIGIGGHGAPVDLGVIGSALIRSNGAIVGTVNAGRRHYPQAVEVLEQIDADWLRALITRRVPLADWPSAIVRSDDDVKVVVEFAS